MSGENAGDKWYWKYLRTEVNGEVYVIGSWIRAKEIAGMRIGEALKKLPGIDGPHNFIIACYAYVADHPEEEPTTVSVKTESEAGPVMGEVAVDMVNFPPHYKSASGLEAIDVIEAFELDFLTANCVKYVLRHKNKGNAIQDLSKARWYLNRAIANLEKAGQAS